MKPRQYTVRQIPERVDATLRAVAAARGISLNDAALEALEKSLGLGEAPVVHNDLDQFCHTWREDPEFEEAIRIFDCLPQLSRVSSRQ